MLNANFQSSNPVLAKDDVFEQYYGEIAGTARANVTTLQGVVNKTAILIGIAVLAGAGGYALAPMFGGLLLPMAIVTMLVVFGLYFVLAGRPKLAPVLAPVYAVVEGFFLGVVTGVLDSLLAGFLPEAAATGYLALQAFVITISIALAMLGLYYARILRPTKLFAAVVSTLVGGVMIMMLISLVLGWAFGVWLPFVSVGDAFAGGTAAYIGIGLNVVVLGIAALTLIMDFGLVEEKVNAGAPKYMEWFCGFALIVSLAWIYFEAVKLAFRLAMLFGSRD